MRFDMSFPEREFFMKLFRGSLTQRRKGAEGAEVLVVVFIAVFLTMGCSDEDNAGNLNGTWSDGWGTIIINTSEMTIEYVNTYQGIISNTPNFTAAHGVIIIEFTKYTEWDYSDWPNSSSFENTENIGKYGALFWTELKSSSVRLVDFWETDAAVPVHKLLNTIEEAEVFFTMDKIGDIPWSGTSPYTK